jgi:hypothetical protein
MSNAEPASKARRRVLVFGAAGLLSLPVAVGLMAYPKRSNACSGPVVGGGTTTTPAPNRPTWAFATKTDGFGRGGGDHRQF